MGRRIRRYYGPLIYPAALRLMLFFMCDLIDDYLIPLPLRPFAVPLQFLLFAAVDESLKNGSRWVIDGNEPPVPCWTPHAQILFYKRPRGPARRLVTQLWRLSNGHPIRPSGEAWALILVPKTNESSPSCLSSSLSLSRCSLPKTGRPIFDCPPTDPHFKSI